jgi:hypothetical protein
LNLKYEVKIFYLCNNDSTISLVENDIDSTTSVPFAINTSNNNNCSIVEISKYIIDNPLTITKINHRFRIGKYSIEIKPIFNNSKYCPANECAYLEDDKVYCDSCSKIVYFLDLATYKENERLLKKKPSDEDLICLKNTNKYSKLSSFITLTALDSYEGSLNLYENNTIFNLNEAFIVNTSVPITVSLELSSETMCNLFNPNRVTENIDSNEINQSTKKWIIWYGVYVVSFVVAAFVAISLCFGSISYIFHRKFCKYNLIVP